MQNATQAIYSYAQWVLTLFTEGKSHPPVKQGWLQVSQLHTVQKCISASRRSAGDLPAGLYHTSVVRRFAQFDSSVGYEMVGIKIQTVVLVPLRSSFSSAETPSSSP